MKSTISDSARARTRSQLVRVVLEPKLPMNGPRDLASATLKGPPRECWHGVLI